MTAPRHSAEDVDRAVAALAADPGRFEHALEIVTHGAPGLHRILGESMRAAGWEDDTAGQAEQIAALGDAERAGAIQALAAEQASMHMLLGVAVGLELSRELQDPTTDPGETP